MASLFQLKKELRKLAKPKQAEILQRFFKTGKGEYGEGDVFLGIKVPVQRQVARKYSILSLSDIKKLLRSKIHEERMVSLFILVSQYEKADKALKKEIFNFYLKNTAGINNWDLVDLSAPNIVGNFLLDKPRNILYKLAKSKMLWERRIAILATFAFIRNNDLKDAFKLSEILLNDKHDLMHKAVGWMLREEGKRDQPALERFLKKYAKKMPRTMLRYAIERFSEKKRQYYLNF
jgi:3-methyladenine DNA glycosylase AlkD